MHNGLRRWLRNGCGIPGGRPNDRRDAWPSAAELERTTQRRYLALLLAFALTFTSGFAIAFTVQQAWEEAIANAAMAAVSLACAAWAWRTSRPEWPMRVLSAALIAMLAWKTVEQGAPLPAAGWWLSIMPFILAGAGLYAMAVGGVTLFVTVVTWLYFGPHAGTAALGEYAGIGPTRQYIAIVGSEAIALVMILAAIRGRRETARAIEATRGAAIEAMGVKARFLANMSHEIRTPLNGVIGTAELLRAKHIDEAQRARLTGLLEQSAGTLLAIVNDVLDWTKLDAGKVVLEARPVHLRRLVFEANELFAVQAYNKGIELTSSCNPDVPRVFIGDPTRLRQIIDNLVGNAVKFTSSGGVHMHLSLEAEATSAASSAQPRHCVRIEVADSGIGIDQQRLSSLFKAFTQADESVTRRFGGTGLGLAISLELARLMGGRIDVVSALGRGSTFALTVPLEPWTQPGALPAAKPRSDLLLASASRGVQRHVKTILHDLGIEPRIVRELPMDDCGEGYRLLLVDAPLLASLPDSRAWLQRQAQARRRIAVIAPLGADFAGLLPDDVLLLYKPIRRGSLKAVLAALERTTADEAVSRESLPSPPPLGPHVLVAEDDTVNQLVVQAMLTDLGATCVLAANGREALECLAAESFDLVLMDMQMPELDGVCATRALRAIESGSAARRVPVVAMTASAAGEDLSACRQAGMDDVLPKPFGIAGIRSVLRTHCPAPTAREAGDASPSSTDVGMAAQPWSGTARGAGPS
ncbi:ATP-binding protein [Piscinibacter sp. XHJ-5]|uniref:ATP-binding protein n=1 Tax=Piscinibacter sp. XHJ-5 TaxID=3037797 RepID=UPI00245362E8|nr:ATP-binding protein [Piscinibacter sp. XHJ-5]